MNKFLSIFILTLFVFSFSLTFDLFERFDPLQIAGSSQNSERESAYRDFRSNTAGVFFTQSVDADEIKNRFNDLQGVTADELRQRRRSGLSNDPVKILIVPGHDDEHYGTSFNGLREVDLNRDLAKRISNFLKTESSFTVYQASDENGYDRSIARYFDKNEEDILDFREEYKNVMESLVNDGKVSIKRGVFHNEAPSTVAFKLYGINKWANDNDIDIIIHVHFNDQAGRVYGEKGDFQGFSIYVPESQFSNAKASKIFADSLFDNLKSKFKVSNAPGENKGVVEDQELIAIGAYNTLDPISVLVEYGYIYEDRFQDEESRDSALNDLAFQTFLGIRDFFSK